MVGLITSSSICGFRTQQKANCATTASTTDSVAKSSTSQTSIQEANLTYVKDSAKRRRNENPPIFDSEVAKEATSSYSKYKHTPVAVDVI
jgi:hypothetical protein